MLKLAPRLFGFALLSHCLIGQELVLTRLFSATIAYYFAFLAVSLALVGLGGGAIWVHLRKYAKDHSASRHTGKYVLASAVSFHLALGAYLYLYPHVGFLTASGFFALAGVAAVFAVPFFFAGVATALVLHDLREHAGWAYGADLMGAAVGAGTAIILMEHIPAHAALLWLAVGVSIASLPFFAHQKFSRVAPATSICIMLAAAAVFGFPQLQAWRLEFARGTRMLPILMDSWNSLSRITLHKRAFGHWGQPHINPDRVPPQMDFRIDGSAETAITRFRGDLSEVRFLRRDVDALPYWVLDHPPKRAMVLGSGGGNGVLTALLFGSKSVTAVEINPLIPRLLYGPLASFAGPVYRHPAVELAVENARTYVRRDTRLYDVVTLTYVDTLASTSGGAYALTENYLYTVEAFHDFLARVAPGGVFAFLRTRTRMPADDLKASLLAREALRKMGIQDPRRNFIIVGTWSIPTRGVSEVLVKPQGFSDPEISIVRKFATENGFDLLYAPAGENNSPVYSAAIEVSDPAALIVNYPANIAPRSDDSPFFFFNLGESDQQNVSVRVLPVGLGIVLGLAFVFLWAIPRTLEPSGALPWPFLKLFSAVGLGFMLVEFVLMQRFILLLGNPTWALASILVGLLLAAGAGSFLSRRIARSHRSFGMVLIAAALCILAANLIQPWLIDRAIRFSMIARLGVVAILVLPLGFLLGIPVPTGIRFMTTVGNHQAVPWAWAANGFFSVLGSIGAVASGIFLGFRATLLIATLCYFLAALVALRLPEENLV